MRFAFVASLTRRGMLREIAAQLKAMEHEVVSTWIDTDEQDEDLTDTQKQTVAIKNNADLARGQVVVAFGEKPETPGVHRGGRHAEFGYVYGRGQHCLTGGPKHIIVVGPRETTMHYLPGIRQVDTVAEFMTWAKQLSDGAGRTE